MDIKLEKQRLIKWIDELKDERVISILLELKEKNIDWWDELTPQERNAIQRGIEQTDAGMVTDNGAVLKKYLKWVYSNRNRK